MEAEESFNRFDGDVGQVAFRYGGQSRNEI